MLIYTSDELKYSHLRSLRQFDPLMETLECNPIAFLYSVKDDKTAGFTETVTQTQHNSL